MRFLVFFLLIYSPLSFADRVNINGTVITEIIVREVTNQVLKGESTIDIDKTGVSIGKTAIQNPNNARCWNSQVYDSQGNVSVVLRCH